MEPVIESYIEEEFSMLLTHFSPVSHFYTPWKTSEYQRFTYDSGLSYREGLFLSNVKYTSLTQNLILFVC